MRSWRAKHWLPPALLVGGLLLSGLLAWVQHQHNRQLLAAAAQDAARQTVDRGLAQLDRSVLGLRGARGYLLGVGVDKVTADGFRAYMATRDLPHEFPGVLGHGYIRRVAPAAESRYLAAMHERVDPGFRIRELKPHQGERRVIELIEPLAPNRAARGLDIASEANRRLASEQALEADVPVLTGPIRLVQSRPGSSMGLLMLLRMPVGAAPGEAPGYGVSSGASGYVYAPVQLDELLESAGWHQDLVTVVLRDVTDPARPQDFQLPAAASAGGADTPVVTLDREVMRRHWRFSVQALPALEASLHLMPPVAVGVAGAVLSVVLAWLARLQLSLRQNTQKALAERIRLRTLLDNASDAIVGLDLEGRVILWNRAATQLFGFTHSEAAGQSLRQLIIDEAHLEEDATLIRSARDGYTTPPFETSRRRADGTEVEVEISAGPIYDADGRVAGVAKVLRPIRERLDQLRRLKAYGEELEQQVKLRTEAAEANRQDLRAVLDAMPSMVGSWDAELHNRFANKAYATYFGHTSEEIASMTLPELLGPELFSRNQPYVQRALAGEEQQFERELPLADGRGVRHTLAHYLPQRHNGKVTGFYVLVHDITAVKQAQQRLSESEAMLARTETMARLGGWELDVPSQALRWSDGTCLVHALPPGHVPTLDEAIGYYPPGERERIQEAVARSMATGEPWDLELQLVRADGQRIWVRARGAADLQDGQPVRLSGSIQDITEQVQARQQVEQAHQLLQAAIDTVGEAFVLWGPDDCLVLCNEKYRALHQLSSDLIVPGASFESIVAEGARRGQFKDALGREEDWLQERLAAHRQATLSTLQELADGRVLRVAERRLADGHTVGFLFDVTELVRARHSAEAASRAKTEFLSSTSHEIRTPLNAIIGLSYLLEREALPQEPLKLVRRIGLAAKSLLGIVNDVLDLSKIEAGQLELDEQPFALRELAEEVMGVYEPAGQRKGLSVTLTLAPDLPAWLQGDAGRLRQILANLLSNAIKFTDQGTVQLDLHRGEPADWLEIQVRDTGIGIDPEVQQRLFKPFEQADASTARRFGGTGLGLSIVAQLARLMGGTASVHSEPGQGSCFTIGLPLREAQEPKFSASGQQTPIRVLLADDDDTQRQGLAAMMRSLGWQTTEVPGGQALVTEAARAWQRQQPYDVLVVDWKMADLDGLASLEQLRPQIPEAAWPAVLLVSQQEMGPLRADPRAAWAEHVLAKPIDASTLFNAVSGSLAAHAGRMQQLVDVSVQNSDELVWLGGLRVLVVDDNALNLEVARKVLEREGAVVVTCDSGPVALRTLRQLHGSFDIVLLDVQMPGMDGNEVARRTREIEGAQDLPIVALTAGALREERERALAAGMNDFLTKPLDPRRMIACLRKLVARRTGQTIAVSLRKKPTAAAQNASPGALGIEGIDEAAINSALREDLPLLLSMLRRFIAEFEAVVTEAPANLPARMHKLRGGAQVIGAASLASATVDVEAACHAGDAEAIRRSLEVLDRRLRGLIQAAKPALDAESRRLVHVQEQLVQQSAQAQPVSDAGLDELRELVASQSTRAKQKAQEQAPSLIATLGQERVARLLSALEEFDFREAAAQLGVPLQE